MRRIAGLLVFLVLPLLASSCLAPSGPIIPVSSWEAPDPAIYTISTSSARIFSTQASFYEVRNVPTFQVSLSTGNIQGNVTDALPVLPDWARGTPNQKIADVWAPSIHYSSGYKLMYSARHQSKGSAANPNQHCIGRSASSSLAGPYGPSQASTFLLCGPDGHNYIDPEMFIDSASNKRYLLWSHQWLSGGAWTSEILMQEMDSIWYKFKGSPTVLLTEAQAASVSGSVSGHTVVENPDLVRDPYNGYDLIVSYGNWEGPAGSYKTLEVPCLIVNGACSPANGKDISSMFGLGHNAGGASLAGDSSPDYNYMVWHAGTKNNRKAYISKTVSVNLNP